MDVRAPLDDVAVSERMPVAGRRQVAAGGCSPARSLGNSLESPDAVLREVLESRAEFLVRGQSDNVSIFVLIAESEVGDAR